MSLPPRHGVFRSSVCHFNASVAWVSRVERDAAGWLLVECGSCKPHISTLNQEASRLEMNDGLWQFRIQDISTGNCPYHPLRCRFQCGPIGNDRRLLVYDTIPDPHENVEVEWQGVIPCFTSRAWGGSRIASQSKKGK